MIPELDLNIPKKFIPLFDPDNFNKRFIPTYGGRGGGKSHQIAQYLLVRAMREKILILCTREFQNSIANSVHKVISDKINENEVFRRNFIINKTEITCRNGSKFIFKGLWQHASEIKSLEGVLICWIEEAHNISKESLEYLVPTIRLPNSQIIFSLNPKSIDSPSYDYILNPRPNSLIINANYEDNPFFPEVSRGDMEYDREHNYEKYKHVWCGEVQELNNACILKDKFIIKEFETHKGVDFLYGSDFGYSEDPSCLIRSYIHDDNLYIDYESFGHRIEIKELPQLFDRVPGSREHLIIGDNSRPEVISYLNQENFNVKGSKKGAGSVIEGIEYMRSFKKIICHIRCENVAYELQNYSWKIDKFTQKILQIIVDKDNHGIDAIRYGLEPVRKFGRSIRASKINIQKLGL